MELNQNLSQEQINKILQAAQQTVAQATQQAAQKSMQPIAPQTPQSFSPPEETKMFDAAEISELSSIREAYEQVTIAFGQLEMQKREVIKNEKRINEKFTAIEAQEKVFLDKIVAKYGEGTFDINTGVFTPKK
jgi:hypothetical protein